MEFRTPYNYDTLAASDESGLSCPESSLAKQEFKDESDINTIVQRFGIGYEMPEGMQPVTNAVFEEIYDFQSAMNAVIDAQKTFEALDANLRYRFGNDPAAFVDFCSDPNNGPELVRLGLAVKRPDPVDSNPAAPQ